VIHAAIKPYYACFKDIFRSTCRHRSASAEIHLDADGSPKSRIDQNEPYTEYQLQKFFNLLGSRRAGLAPRVAIMAIRFPNTKYYPLRSSFSTKRDLQRRQIYFQYNNVHPQYFLANKVYPQFRHIDAANLKSNLPSLQKRASLMNVPQRLRCTSSVPLCCRSPW
jgi:hypothetical protein